jgi:glyoxylase-like metal-dependent hydrolase (beta-lactamase superfamily II)
MLIAGFPADAFGTNCYLVAPAPGEQCVVVDPGIGVIDQLDALLTEHRLHPAAVLLTHGHLDHTFSAAPVCGARGITAYIHPDDREMLADPAKGLSVDLKQLFGGRLPYTEPEDVAELTDGATLSLAGLEITVDHAPGHTRGSVLFRLPTGGQLTESAGWLDSASFIEAADEVCLSGDVLFAGSIGRTDLPGGDTDEILRSIRQKLYALPEDTRVLPGHMQETTIAHERAHNPFVRPAR